MRKIVKFSIAFIVAVVFLGWPQLLSTQSIISPVQQTISRIIPTPIPTPPSLNKDEIIELVNGMRAKNQLPALKIGKQTCALLDLLSQNQSPSDKQIFSTCPSCARVQFISINQPVNQINTELVFNQDEKAAALITDSKLTHICSQTNSNNAYLVFVEARSTEVSSKAITTPIKDISEDELWQAFGEYRKAQGRNELTRDDSLCNYARKRVNDHLSMLAENRSPESYPVPEKYPLDAHDGFKQDADSGLVFDITHKNEVAENLAYWPSALYAVHVIEWGWDTSTEGHREAQLSNDWSAACLTGKQGFYVAIFGR